MSEAFKTFATLDLDSSKFDSKLSGAASKIGNGLATAAKIGTAALVGVTAATTALVGALVKGTGKTAEYGDNIDKMSQKLGLSAEAYQKWDYVLGQAGTSIDNMAMGIKTLTNKLDDAKTGSKDAQEMFAKLGMSLEDIQAMSREEIFEGAIRGFQGMADSTERAALANDLFGRSGQELTPLFNATTEETEELLAATEKYGMIMSDEAVKASADYQDALDTLKRTMGGVKRGMLSDFMPSITTVMTGLSELFSGGDGTAKISEGLSNLVNKISEILPKIMEVGGNIIMSLVDSLVQNLPMLIKAATNLISQILQGLKKSFPMITTAIFDIAKLIIKELPAFLKVGLEIVIALVHGITENISEIINTLVDVIFEIVEFLTQPSTIVELVQAGIGLILALTQGLLEAIPRIIQELPVIIENIVNALVEATPLLIDAGIQLFMALVEAIPVIIDALGEALPQILETIVNGLITLGGILWDMVLQPALQAVWNWIKGLGQSALNAGKTFLDNVVQFFKDLPYKIGEFLGNVIGKVLKWAIEFRENARTAASNFFNNVVQFFKDLPGKIQSFLSEIIGKIIKWAIEFPAKAKEGAQRMFNNIVNTLKDLPNKMLTIGRNIVEGVWNGIKNATTWITNKVKDFARGILDGIKNALGIHSPSREASWLGKMFDTGFAKGIGDNLQVVKDAVGRVADVTTGTLESDISGDFGSAGGVSAGSVYNMGGVNITVNGANYSDEQELARAVARELQVMTNRRAAVYA